MLMSRYLQAYSILLDTEHQSAIYYVSSKLNHVEKNLVLNIYFLFLRLLKVK